RLLADMGRKGRNRTCVLGLKQGVRIEIAFCRWIVELFFLQRFECSDHLAPAPQYKIADRPPTKILDSLGELRADTDPGAELFVALSNTLCPLKFIAGGGEDKKPTPAKISDNRWPCVTADTRHAKCDALLLPALAETLRKFIQRKRAGDGAGSMV